MNDQQKRQATSAFNTGIVFLESALRAMDLVPITATEFSAPIPAGLVNIAFANELLLKSLLLTQGQSVRGHDLRDLFKKLDPATQAAIRQDGALFTGKPESNFTAGLKNMSRTFEEVRYHWEKLDPMSFDITVLMGLAYACIRALRDADVIQRSAGLEHTIGRLSHQSPNIDIRFN